MAKQDRRLSAIMFTDIVGSTSMMAEDEDRAVAAVSRHKAVVEQCAAKHEGEVMNFYGDGSMSIFSSATSALNCAMEIQLSMKNPVNIPLRIGIHIGEILIQDNEVFGDGVNVASRIESLGQAGTVLFSEEVYRKIRNNHQFKSELVGSFEFKNVQEPMDVYALANEGFPVPKKETVTGKLKMPGGITESQPKAFGKILKLFGIRSGAEKKLGEEVKSIVVLPFEKTGNLGEHEFIAEGISDEIRSQLVNIKDLKVISRSSSVHYKSNSPLKRIAKELGVSYVLEGRIQGHAQHAVINAELSHAPTDKLIWSLPSVQFSIDNIFRLQNEIAQRIMDELKVKLSDSEKTKLSKIPTTNTEAYLLFQKGQELLHRGYGYRNELDTAVGYFQRAVELDPEFTKGWIGLADAHLDYIFWGRAAATEMVEKALPACLKAIELDPLSGEAWGGMGAIHFYRLDMKAAKENLLKAVSLSPGYVEAFSKLGWISSRENDYEQAIFYFTRAQELDPLSSKYLGDIGQVYYNMGFYEQGIEYIENAMRKFPNDSWLLWVLGFLYIGRKDLKKARELFLSRPTGQKNWLLGYVYGKLGESESAREILNYNLEKRKSEYVPAHMIAVIYLGLGETNQCLQWLETDLKEGPANILFWNMRKDPIFEELRETPGFVSIMERLKV